MIWLLSLGGIIGTLSRYYLGKWCSARTGSSFPWGTWIINITGSFVLGVLFSLHSADKLPDWAWLTFGVGFCGGYTTFSTFGYETSQLIEKKKGLAAIAYVSSTVLVGVCLAWAGIVLGSGQ